VIGSESCFALTALVGYHATRTRLPPEVPRVLPLERQQSITTLNSHHPIFHTNTADPRIPILVRLHTCWQTRHRVPHYLISNWCHNSKHSNQYILDLTMPVKVGNPTRAAKIKAEVEKRADSASKRRLSHRRSFDSVPVPKTHESTSLSNRQGTSRVTKRPTRWRGPVSFQLPIRLSGSRD